MAENCKNHIVFFEHIALNCAALECSSKTNTDFKEKKTRRKKKRRLVLYYGGIEEKKVSAAKKVEFWSFGK